MKKAILAILVTCNLLQPGAGAARSQYKTSNFIIDPTKPYVYLKFDHTGPRRPVSRHEPDQGLWIRIVNNCQIPIVVATFNPETGDAGIAVYDDIVPVDLHPPPLGYVLRPGEMSSSPAEEPKPPNGYSQSDLLTTSTIEPGKNLLFSVPINHVGRTWELQIKFYLELPGGSYGYGPRSLLSFGWSDIPKKFRENASP